MKKFIQTTRTEIHKIVFDEMHNRLIKNNHIDLKQLLGPSNYRKVEYNFIPEKDRPYADKIREFIETTKQEREKGEKSDKEFEDWCHRVGNEFFSDMEEYIESELFGDENSNDEVDEVQIRRIFEEIIKYEKNPLDEIGDHFSNYNLENGIKYHGEISQFIFDQNLSRFKINENSNVSSDKYFPEYEDEIRKKESKRVNSLKDGNGYVIPVYDKSESVYFLKDEYEKIKNSIDSDSSIRDTLTLGKFRDLLEKQLDRQFSIVEKLNEIIIDYLNEFYIIVESNYLESRRQIKNPADSKDQFLDLYQILIEMRSVNEFFLLDSQSEDTFKLHMRVIREIPYAKNRIKESLTKRLEKVFYKKMPILDVCSHLIGKLRICESLLEDLLLDNSLKNFHEFNEMLERERSKDKAPYGFHEEQWEWIVKTHEEQLNEMPNPNQAVHKTIRLYKNEFGYKIGKSTVDRIYKKYKKI